MAPLLCDRAGTAALANRATHFALPPEKRLAAEIPIARQDFLAMATENHWTAGNSSSATT